MPFSKLSSNYKHYAYDMSQLSMQSPFLSKLDIDLLSGVSNTFLSLVPLSIKNAPLLFYLNPNDGFLIKPNDHFIIVVSVYHIKCPLIEQKKMKLFS